MATEPHLMDLDLELDGGHARAATYYSLINYYQSFRNSLVIRCVSQPLKFTLISWLIMACTNVVFPYEHLSNHHVHLHLQ